MLGSNRITATVNVQPDYIPADDKREFWMDIRGGVAKIESALNRRGRAEGNIELLLVGRIAGVVKRELSVHLGLE